MKIQIMNKSKHPLPKYVTIGSSAVDLCANIEKPITLKPMARTIIPTGIFVEMPLGVEAQVRARSGLAIKHGICLANGIGTIDSDYRGEVGVILINLGVEPFIINDGDRIAQMVFLKYETAEFEVVEKLSETKRGTGGFGSTGK